MSETLISEAILKRWIAEYGSFWGEFEEVIYNSVDRGVNTFYRGEFTDRSILEGLLEFGYAEQTKESTSFKLGDKATPFLRTFDIDGQIKRLRSELADLEEKRDLRLNDRQLLDKQLRELIDDVEDAITEENSASADEWDKQVRDAEKRLTQFVVANQFRIGIKPEDSVG